jgi:serine phosphatase RsbU (regulator of sigma subunit)
VGQALAAIGDPDTTGELAQRFVATVTMLWSDILGADLFLPQPGSGELRGVRDASSGVALLGAIASPFGDGAAVRVIPVTASLFVADRSSMRGSSMSVPVVGEHADGATGSVEGFLILQRRPSAPDFTARDLEALGVLGRRVGELMQRMRARGGRSVAAWFQRDMASAREMQRMFLPQPLQSNSAHVRVLAEYQPAFEVGGDFYDFVDLGDGRLLAAIGDVSGKGVTAALMMSRISSELHRLAAETAGPADMLARLNRSMPGVMQDDRFVTVVCVLLDVPNRRWVVSNAGHVVPILRRRSGTVSGLSYSSGPPIGMLANATYEDSVFPLESKDILVLATDGVFERMAGARRPCSTMGQCKLTEVVQKAPHDLAEIHRRILNAVESTSTGRDDVALLGLELTE